MPEILIKANVIKMIVLTIFILIDLMLLEPEMIGNSWHDSCFALTPLNPACFGYQKLRSIR